MVVILLISVECIIHGGRTIPLGVLVEAIIPGEFFLVETFDV